MSNLTNRIKKSIEYAEMESENMDEVSWGMEKGILISYNEGKDILKAYDMLQKISNIENVAFGLKNFDVDRFKKEINDVLIDE